MRGMSSTESLESASPDEEYDCMDCGACCGCYPIFVSEEDAMKEPKIMAEGILEKNFLRTDRRAYRLHPLPFLKACPFLGEDKLCRIYQTRPEVCRKFEAGSEQCVEARRRLGIRGKRP